MKPKSRRNDDSYRSAHYSRRRLLPVELLRAHPQNQAVELGKLLDCAGVFAWLVLPLLGAMLAVPQGHSLAELFGDAAPFSLWMTMAFGVLWGIGGLTFGLSMRYLGVALGQSIALGTCAALGTVMGPVLLNVFFLKHTLCMRLRHQCLLEWPPRSSVSPLSVWPAR